MEGWSLGNGKHPLRNTVEVDPALPGAETPRDPRGAGRGQGALVRSGGTGAVRGHAAPRVGPARPPGQCGRCGRQHEASAGLEGDASFLRPGPAGSAGRGRQVEAGVGVQLVRGPGRPSVSVRSPVPPPPSPAAPQLLLSPPPRLLRTLPDPTPCPPMAAWQAGGRDSSPVCR